MGVAIQTLQELFDGCIKLGDLTYERLEGGVLQQTIGYTNGHQGNTEENDIMLRADYQ